MQVNFTIHPGTGMEQEVRGARIIMIIDKLLHKNVCNDVCGLWTDGSETEPESFLRD